MLIILFRKPIFCYERRNHYRDNSVIRTFELSKPSQEEIDKMENKIKYIQKTTMKRKKERIIYDRCELSKEVKPYLVEFTEDKLLLEDKNILRDWL